VDEKKSWPYDEFDAETSPEHETLFAEIRGELAYRKRLSMEERDRLLRDYRAAWGGMKDSEDGSVLDGPIPQSYVDRWYEINGKESNYSGQQKDVEAIIAAGVSISPTPDGGFTLRQGAGGAITIPSDQIAEFLDGCRQAATQRSPNRPSNAVSVASDNTRYSQNAKLAYGNPVLEERQKRNEAEMKKYAEQSSMVYPRWK